MDISCPACTSPIIKSYGDNKVKLRSRIVVFEGDGSVMAKCVNCGAEVGVPLKLEPAASELQPATRIVPRHYIAPTRQ